MAGQGVTPRSYHPVAHMLDDDEALRRLAHIRQVVASAVEQMPTQDEFLAQIGGAIDAAKSAAA